MAELANEYTSSAARLLTARLKVDTQLAAFTETGNGDPKQLESQLQPTQVEQTTARLLQGLPGRCRPCLASFMTNLSVEANRGNMDTSEMWEEAKARKDAAWQEHQTNGGVGDSVIMCRMGRIVL